MRTAGWLERAGRRWLWEAYELELSGAHGQPLASHIGRAPRNYVNTARIETPQAGASRSCKTQAIEGFRGRYLHTDYVCIAY